MDDNAKEFGKLLNVMSNGATNLDTSESEEEEDDFKTLDPESCLFGISESKKVAQDLFGGSMILNFIGKTVDTSSRLFKSFDAIFLMMVRPDGQLRCIPDQYKASLKSLYPGQKDHFKSGTNLERIFQRLSSLSEPVIINFVERTCFTTNLQQANCIRETTHEQRRVIMEIFLKCFRDQTQTTIWFVQSFWRLYDGDEASTRPLWNTHEEATEGEYISRLSVMGQILCRLVPDLTLENYFYTAALFISYTNHLLESLVYHPVLEKFPFLHPFSDVDDGERTMKLMLRQAIFLLYSYVGGTHRLLVEKWLGFQKKRYQGFDHFEFGPNLSNTVSKIGRFSRAELDHITTLIDLDLNLDFFEIPADWNISPLKNCKQEMYVRTVWLSYLITNASTKKGLLEIVDIIFTLPQFINHPEIKKPCSRLEAKVDGFIFHQMAPRCPNFSENFRDCVHHVIISLLQFLSHVLKFEPGFIKHPLPDNELVYGMGPTPPRDENSNSIESKKGNDGKAKKEVVKPINKREDVTISEEKKPAPVTYCHSVGCFKLAVKRCSKCRLVTYCSQSCQKTNWKEHKRTCRTEENKPAPVTYCDSVGCFKVAGKRCSKCRLVTYCSQSCQKANWKEHKLTCGK